MNYFIIIFVFIGMENSKFERLSDEQLNKYMAYFNKITKDLEYSDLADFYNQIMYDDALKTKIGSPIGITDLGRLDLEYLYYLLENNSPGGPYENRPQLQEEEFNWVTRERVTVDYTRTGEIDTYLYGELDQSYLSTLRDEGEIEPWDWEITDKDVRDGETMDDWFDV
jgi:hypothetical protein